MIYYTDWTTNVICIKYLQKYHYVFVYINSRLTDLIYRCKKHFFCISASTTNLGTISDLRHSSFITFHKSPISLINLKPSSCEISYCEATNLWNLHATFNCRNHLHSLLFKLQIIKPNPKHQAPMLDICQTIFHVYGSSKPKLMDNNRDFVK